MSYKIKGGSVYFTVDFGRDVTGKRIRKFFSWKIDRRYTEKALAAKLEQIENDFKEKYKNGLGNFTDSIRFADFLPVYFENKKGKLSPTVFEEYKRILYNIFVPVLGHLSLGEIKVQTLQRIINSLSSGQYKKADEKPVKPLAPASVVRY